MGQWKIKGNRNYEKPTILISTYKTAEFVNH
jgi:hypothetical protein